MSFTLAPYIRHDVFETNDAEPTRDGFGRGLKRAGEADARVVALCADLTESTRIKAFADAFPERYVEIGVAEQNLATVASGMAAMGKIPFIASYAMFSPGRNWEQIRTTIAYNDQPVNVVGAHAGVSVGPDGATHQAIEDIALMRVIPNMTVLAPCDGREAELATIALAMYGKPSYMRLGREKTPSIIAEGAVFVLGKAQLFLTRDQAHSQKVGIIVTGSLAYHALIAAKELNEKYSIGASVLHLGTIKPLDKETVQAFAEEHDVLVTVEEHQIIGGMGSAVTEFLSEVLSMRIHRIGVRDMFGQSGTPEELIEAYGLDAKAIITAVQKLVA